MNASTMIARLGIACCCLFGVACARPAGDRPWVAGLELRGVRNVSKRALSHGLASKPTPWWQRGAVHFFDELELARDRMRVERFYEKEGYYAAKVVLAEGRTRAGSRAVDVVISVEEGPPTFIGDVRIMGLADVDEVTKAKARKVQLGLRRGQVFHHEDYEEFKGDLLRLLRERGFPKARITGLVDVKPTENLANITVTADPSGTGTPPDVATPEGGVPIVKEKP